jgi:hypothetical protein
LVPTLVPSVTVAQLVNDPPFGSLKENRAVFDWLGAREAAAWHEMGRMGPAPGVQLMGSVPPPPVNRPLDGAPETTSVRVIGLTEAAVPIFETVTVQSTDCGPFTAHVLVTFKSGATALAAVRALRLRHKKIAAETTIPTAVVLTMFISPFLRAGRRSSRELFNGSPINGSSAK